ncbi:MAG: phosphatidic acid phosphatase, partial [Cyclobacteriaceae bacterium]|nr:phosphatidic acid phosphatase [Cyclobacteriaceae bacterium]
MTRFGWIVALMLVFSCSTNNGEYKAKIENAEFVHRSIKAVTDIIVHDIFSPPVASRIYAYISVAGYEAIIPKDDTYVSLAGQLHGLTESPKPEEGKEYCYEVASVQAILKVGRALIFSEDKLDNFYTNLMEELKATGVPDDVFERSLAYGDQVADHIIAWSS